MVDVNYSNLQGDAHLLKSGDEVYLIDAGYSPQARESLIPFLQEQGVTHIDKAFVSHPHRDHYEGFAAVLDSGVTIGTVYYNLPPKSIKDCCYSEKHFLKHVAFWQKKGAKTHAVREGDTYLFGNTKLQVVHAQNELLEGENIDVNDLSLILSWQVGKHRVLFTGDLNKKVGRWLAKNKTAALKADVLKAPHHGGRGIAPPAFFEAVAAPQLMVPTPLWIWCGERANQVRKFATAQNSETWVNGLHGTVSVKFYTDEIVTKGAKQEALACAPEALVSEVNYVPLTSLLLLH